MKKRWTVQDRYGNSIYLTEGSYLDMNALSMGNIDHRLLKS